MAFWSAKEEMEHLKSQEEGEFDDDEVENFDSDDMDSEDSLEEGLEKWSIDTEELRETDNPENTANSLPKEDSQQHNSTEKQCTESPSHACHTEEASEGTDGESINRDVSDELSEVKRSWNNKSDILCGEELIEYLVSQFTGQTYLEGVTTIGLVKYIFIFIRFLVESWIRVIYWVLIVI